MFGNQAEESSETMGLADDPPELAGGELTDARGELLGPEETVDGVPVLADVRAVEIAPSVSLPAVQTAAAVATGFVAGAATLALVRRHSARKLARARVRPRRGAEGLSIVGSRSFLVDVHLISKPGE